MRSDANLIAMPVPWRLSAFYFCYFAYVAAMVAYFPVYLDWRGLDAGEIALVLALPQLARIFAPTAWGRLADRTGADRAIVVFACAVVAAAFALMPLAHGVAGIALLIGVMSVLSAGALPLVEATTMASLGSAAGRYGPIRLWGSIGFIVVTLAGGAWLDVGSAGSVQPALVALSLAALVAALWLPSRARTSPLHQDAGGKTGLSGKMQSLLAAGFCMSAAHGALYAYYTLHLQRAGYSASAIGALWTLGVLAEIVVFWFLPALFRRYRLSTILVASFACAAARFLGIGWAVESIVVLVAAQLLHAATFGSFHAASVAAVQRVFPPHARGRGQALFSALAYGAGGAAGILLSGWAWESAGPGFAFSLAAAAGLVGAFFAYRLKRGDL
jgi:PPP family 3-phenylpropionic acid transporter